MSKRKISLFIAGMVLAQELTYTQAMAQQGKAQQPDTDIIAVGGSNRSTTGFLSSGDYNINQSVTNYTQTATEILKQKGVTNKEDKEYLASVGKRLAQGFASIVEKERAFKALGQRASTTTNVTLDEYLNLMNDINAALETLRIEIQTSMLISKDTLPSNGFKVGNMTVDMGPTSLIDMSAAMAPFQRDLETIITRLNSVTFKTLAHKGAYESVMENALNPDLSRFPQMTSEEIETAVQKIEQLRVISKRAMDSQQILADRTVNLVKNFIQMVGTEEFLRFRNDNDKTFASEAFKGIETAFFMRSYLRRKYGLQIGAIQPVAYVPAPLHMESFSKEMLFPIITALNSIKNQTARGDQDLWKAYNSARQFVEQYDKKLTPVLSQNSAAKIEKLKKQRAALPKNASLWEKGMDAAKIAYDQVTARFANREEILASKPVILNEDQKDVAYNSDDTGFTARMSGIFTTITGQVSTTEALLAVMRFVLADIREELMLSQGDLGEMQSYHMKRFMTTDKQIERSVKTMCNIDNTLSADARARARAVTNNAVTCTASNGIFGNVNSGGDNLLTGFRNLITQYNTVEMKRAQDARNLQKLVESSLSSQSNEGDMPDDTSAFDIPKKN